MDDAMMNKTQLTNILAFSSLLKFFWTFNPLLTIQTKKTQEKKILNTF